MPSRPSQAQRYSHWVTQILQPRGAVVQPRGAVGKHSIICQLFSGGGGRGREHPTPDDNQDSKSNRRFLGHGEAMGVAVSPVCTVGETRAVVPHRDPGGSSKHRSLGRGARAPASVGLDGV